MRIETNEGLIDPDGIALRLERLAADATQEVNLADAYDGSIGIIGEEVVARIEHLARELRARKHLPDTYSYTYLQED